MEQSENEKRNVSFVVGDKIGPYVYDVCIDGIYYCLDEDHKLAQVIDGENRYTGAVCIPEFIMVDDEEYIVTEIGLGAFCGCQQLTSVHIPDTVLKIGDEAFLLCTSLKEVNIPPLVLSVGHNAFGRCDSMRQEDGCYYADTYLIAARSAEVIEIKPGTRFIGAYAIYNEKGRSLILPETVISYGECCINVDNFDEIHVKNPEPADICACDFSLPVNWTRGKKGKVSGCKLYVPAGCKEKYATADVWCYFSEIIEE